MCKECKLTIDDLEYMDIGQAIDYIEEYVNMKDTNSKDKKKVKNVRQATQSDFDRF